MKLLKTRKKTVKKIEPLPVAAPVAAPPPRSILSQPLPTSPPVAAIESAPPAPPTTIIEAKIDVGFGNQLFLRGQGAGLSWDRGQPLQCVDGQTWRWSAPTTDPLRFKLLLNDRIWAQGEDITADPGKCVGIAPRF